MFKWKPSKLDQSERDEAAAGLLTLSSSRPSLVKLADTVEELEVQLIQISSY